MGDVGKGKGNPVALTWEEALYREYSDKPFSDGILLLGDNLFCGPEDAGDLAAVARCEIEIPFTALIDHEVPFYAALGNHDNALTDIGSIDSNQDWEEALNSNVNAGLRVIQDRRAPNIGLYLAHYLLDRQASRKAR